jgi:hypothetical protein
MNNTFEKQPITEHYFNKSFKTNLECDLLEYLFANFKIELELFGFDLKNNLTININGKYN